MKTIQFRQAIAEAMTEEMRRDESVYLMGEEVAEYNGAYKASKGMLDEFGERRVIDTPISELGFSGIGVGSTMTGNRPIIEFMTFNFALVGIDQIINNAAKIRQMSGGQFPCPIVFRGPTGSAGQLGATHSQAFESWYANCPGLKVIVPSNPYDAKGLLKAAIRDDDPVIFLEHRWLHNTTAINKRHDYRIKIGKAKICKTGKHITILSMSYLTLEALKAAKYLYEKHKISAEVIDLRTIKPLDWQTIFRSIKKTKRLLVLDTGFTTGSVASEIIAKISIEKFNTLKSAPIRLAMPDVPEPTSPALTKNFYTRADDIVISVLKSLRINDKHVKLDFKQSGPADVPDPSFKGPF